MISTAAIDRPAPYQPSQASPGFQPTSGMDPRALAQSAPGTNFTPMSQIDPRQPYQAPSPVNRAKMQDRLQGPKMSEIVGNMEGVLDAPTSQWDDLKAFEDEIKRELATGTPAAASPLPPDVSRAKISRNPYDTKRTTINQVQAQTVPSSLKYAAGPSANAVTGAKNYSAAPDPRSIYGGIATPQQILDGSPKTQRGFGIDVQQPGQVPGRPSDIADIQSPMDQGMDYLTDAYWKNYDQIQKGAKYNTSRIASNIQRARMVDRSGGRGSAWQERQQIQRLAQQLRRSGASRDEATQLAQNILDYSNITYELMS
jgi:hypothetical protein